MEDLNQFVPDVRFEKIPIRNLVSNQEYQRNLSQKHIRRTVANFDLLQVNPVKVSRRDGNQLCFQWPAHHRNRGCGLWLQRYASLVHGL